MKDLTKLYHECLADAHIVGLDISTNILRVSVNNRLSRALGRCKAARGIGGCTYEIEIQPCMLADDVDDATTKNTIMHELIHTCRGCMNHGHEFQCRAMLVNRKLGYNIQTTATVASLEAAGVQLKRKECHYAIMCKKCGAEVERRARWGKTLEHIEQYRHGGSCRGDLFVINLD